MDVAALGGGRGRARGGGVTDGAGKDGMGASLGRVRVGRAVELRGSGFEPRMRPLLAWLAFAARWSHGRSVARRRGERPHAAEPGADREGAGRPGGERRALGSSRRLGLADRPWVRARLLGGPDRRSADRASTRCRARSGCRWSRRCSRSPRSRCCRSSSCGSGIGEWSKIADHRIRCLLPRRGRHLRRGGRGAARAGAHGPELRSIARGHHQQDPPTWSFALDDLRRAHRDLDARLILVVAAEMIGAERGIGALVPHLGHIGFDDR